MTQMQYTNFCCSPAQEVQFKRLLRSLVKLQRSSHSMVHVSSSPVWGVTYLELELTSCVRLELVNDPEQSRRTTSCSLCRHLGNNHRILRRGWVTSHWPASSGISSLLYLLPTVRTAVSNSWDNHNSHVPVPHPPTHPRLGSVTPTVEQHPQVQQDACGLKCSHQCCSPVQQLNSAPAHCVQSDLLVTFISHSEAQQSFLLMKYSCVPGEISASARLCKRLQPAKRSFGSLFALSHLWVPGFHIRQC